MAKSSIGQVTTTQTFQNWLDKTNDIVDLLETDVMTASALGDTTNGNATLVGTFTANTVIGFDDVKTDVIVAKTLSGTIDVNSPIQINTTTQNGLTLVSTSGPRIQYSSGSIIWRTGFLSVGSAGTDNYFTIDTGTGDPKFQLSPAGDLEVDGSITAPGGFTGNITSTGTSTFTTVDINGGNIDGTVIGATNAAAGTFTTVDINGGNIDGTVIGASSATSGTFTTINGTIITASTRFSGNLTGNVTGQVSDISNHDTGDLAEGSNLYFTTARALAAVRTLRYGDIGTYVFAVYQPELVFGRLPVQAGATVAGSDLIPAAPGAENGSISPVTNGSSLAWESEAGGVPDVWVAEYGNWPLVGTWQACGEGNSTNSAQNGVFRVTLWLRIA